YLDQVPLGWRQVNEFAASADLFGVEVNDEVWRLDGRALARLRRTAQSGAQPGEQFVHAERLGDVVVRAGVERGNLDPLGVAGREHDDRYRTPAPQRSGHVDAVHVGQPEVEDHKVGMVPGRQLDALVTGLGQIDFVTMGFETDTESPAHRKLVLDDEDAVHSFALKPKTIVVPPPGVSSTARSPSIAVTKPRATASPSPTPPSSDRSLSRWNGWKTCSRCARGMPGPRSTTRTSMCPCTAAASTRTGTF